MSETTGNGFSSPAAVIAVASIGSASVTSGIHAIAPAIPAIQAEFSLSAAQVAIITSTYLLPSIFSAFAAGLLADRIGVRPVFAAALLVFGAGGVLLLVEHSFWLLVLVRLVQGVAFGAVVALSVSIIGGVTHTRVASARGQSWRIISMLVAEAVFPAAGGVLLGLSWFAPFALQLLALPLAVASWLLLPTIEHRRTRGVRGASRAVLRSPSIVGIQVLGALRFVFKFAVITYYPVLTINHIGMSPPVVGAVLGATALLAAGSATLSSKLAKRWSSAQLIGGCLAVTTVSMVGIAAAEHAVVAVGALLLFGLQEGVYGVAHNVLVTESAPLGVRSTYVGLTGTVRNIGKFAAPVAFGSMTLVLTVSQAFLALGVLGLASVGVARRVSRARPDSATDVDPP